MSMRNLFGRVLHGEAVDTPPIWLMRQAGRYHTPYQQLRRRYAFDALCRTPELAAEVALGPVLDFDFDAAILFSDLLFPLEALGFGLSYDDGPPKLDGSLTPERLASFRPLEDALDRLRFQHEAMKATRARLPADKGIIGFVGGPWTLFVYAVEGTHAGPLSRAKASPELYRAFADRLVPLLIENIRLQFDGGADVVMLFDTAAGELSPQAFADGTALDLARMARAFPARLGYYAKGVTRQHFEAPSSRPLTDAPWAGVGIDARWDLAATLRTKPLSGFVQGNFDQTRLQLTGDDLDREIDRFVEPLRDVDPETIYWRGRSYARWTGAGLCLGLAGALAASRLVGTLLFAVPARDVWSILAAAAILCGTALAAAWLPSRRAALIDPLRSLRED
jgi:uroporphyrinogen decarboxylase